MAKTSQNHSGVGDNVARDKITNNIQISNDRLIRKAQEAYSKIYYWHKKNGKKVFLNFFEDELAKDEVDEYYDIVDSMPAPDIAELDEMIQICSQFFGGILQWSSSEVVEPITNKIRLIEFAKEVKNIKKKFTAKLFENISLDNQTVYLHEAKNILYSNVRELKIINEQKLNNKNIGGENAIIESSKQFGDPLVLTPYLLGFKPISLKDSLVERIINNDINIDELFLESYPEDGNHEECDYYVYLKLTNNTSERIEVVIPEGQIFENRDFLLEGKPSQNLATGVITDILLEANGTHAYKIPSFCINKPYDAPVHIEGNITFYEFEKKGFNNNIEVWDWIEKNYQSIIERFKK